KALVATVEIVANENQASVVVDARPRGTTPLSAPLRVAEGSHILRVYKEGFAAFETRFEVAGGQKVSIAAHLGALTRGGRLRVAERSARAAGVIVDGVVVGTAPWEGTLAVGGHTVLLRGEGNLGTQPASAPVRLNQSATLTLALEPLEAELRVEPRPVSANV